MNVGPTMYLPILCVLLLFKAAAMVGFILYGGVGLGPDEAQYWTWSQSLAWGYYSKPPGIAWQIWLGTKLFGNTELGVRILAIPLSIALSCATYYLAIIAASTSQNKERIAFWSAVMISFIPIGILGSFLAITDGGLILAWTLASIVLAYSLSTHTFPRYYLLAGIILCGALFKWPIYLFWIVVIVCAIFVPWPHFNGLRSRLSYWFPLPKHFLGGILISLLGLLPSVIWNAQHEWATFRHVFATVTGGHHPPGESSHGNFLEFLGMQIGLISPVLFVLLIIAFVNVIRQGVASTPLVMLFCGGSTLLILTAYSFLALFQKVQGNWCVFAYPPSLVFLSWYACERMYKGIAWMAGGVVVSVCLTGIALGIPYMQAHTVWNQVPIPYRLNLFRHNIGWHQLAGALINVGYDPSRDFLFADTYQTTSILNFYGLNQKYAYFFNLRGARKNQFSFWPEMVDEQLGKTGYFVVIEQEPKLHRELPKTVSSYTELLKPYFNNVTYLGMAPLFSSYGGVVKGALLFKCSEYNGLNNPKENFLY